MVVTGNRQTTGVAFHVTGRMYNTIQEMNHFAATWSALRGMYVKLVKDIAFLRASNAILGGTLDNMWGMLVPGEKWIPTEWEMVQ